MQRLIDGDKTNCILDHFLSNSKIGTTALYIRLIVNSDSTPL
jgi:hypothetical protein